MHTSALVGLQFFRSFCCMLPFTSFDWFDRQTLACCKCLRIDYQSKKRPLRTAKWNFALMGDVSGGWLLDLIACGYMLNTAIDVKPFASPIEASLIIFGPWPHTYKRNLLNITDKMSACLYLAAFVTQWHTFQCVRKLAGWTNVAARPENRRKKEQKCHRAPVVLDV